MTKTEIYENVTTAVEALGLSDEVMGELTVIIDENLKPKSGGGSVDLSEVTVEEDGVITEILCATSKVWLPATAEFFYEDKSENAKIIGSDGAPLKRLSRQAESVGKKFIKANRATIQAITDDILEAEDMSAIEGLKTQLLEAKAAKPDYSVVTAELPEVEVEEEA